MYNLMDGSDYEIVPIVYCFSIVWICSFFMLNLLLAVVMQRYQACDEQFR
jgi:hypothetical protein